MRAIVDANPAEHVPRPMRDLMLSGYDWPSLGIALAVILALGLIGIPAHRPQLPLRLRMSHDGA